MDNTVTEKINYARNYWKSFDGEKQQGIAYGLELALSFVESAAREEQKPDNPKQYSIVKGDGDDIGYTFLCREGVRVAKIVAHYEAECILEDLLKREEQKPEVPTCKHCNQTIVVEGHEDICLERPLPTKEQLQPQSINNAIDDKLFDDIMNFALGCQKVPSTDISNDAAEYFHDLGYKRIDKSEQLQPQVTGTDDTRPKPDKCYAETMGEKEFCVFPACHCGLEQLQPQPSKEEQKKLIIDIMQADEEAGLYDSQPQQEADINKLAIDMLAVLSKVLHALQHSNMKGTILHQEITEVVKRAMVAPLRISKSEADKGEPSK